MSHNKKNLEDLEVSINALKEKASTINDSIKKHYKISNKKTNFKENRKNLSNLENEYNAEILNKKSDLNILENKLQKEIYSLKKKQRILVFILYVLAILFICSILLAIELNLFKI